MILVVGGTGEARELAAALHAAGIDVTSSLAGRVARPRLPVGAVRIGGFGGPEGLARWLDEHAIRAVVDASHPFAERISASAATACAATGTPLLRLQRPGWTPGPRDRWSWADDLSAAAALVPRLGTRALLTTGRQGLGAFAEVRDAWFLVRCVDPPDPPLPLRSAVLLDRGPYTYASELELVRRHRIDLVVTKDSGGPLTAAKLEVARELGLPVVVVRRPPRPDVPTVTTVAAAAAWAARPQRGTATGPPRG